MTSRSNNPKAKFPVITEKAGEIHARFFHVYSLTICRIQFKSETSRIFTRYRQAKDNLKEGDAVSSSAEYGEASPRLYYGERSTPDIFGSTKTLPAMCRKAKIH